MEKQSTTPSDNKHTVRKWAILIGIPTVAVLLACKVITFDQIESHLPSFRSPSKDATHIVKPNHPSSSQVEDRLLIGLLSGYWLIEVNNQTKGLRTFYRIENGKGVKYGEARGEDKMVEYRRQFPSLIEVSGATVLLHDCGVDVTFVRVNKKLRYGIIQGEFENGNGKGTVRFEHIKELSGAGIERQMF